MSTQNVEQQVRPHKRSSRARVLAGIAVAMVGAAAIITIRPSEPASAFAAVGVPHALSANALLSMSATGVTGEGSGGTGSIEISSFSFGATNVTPANGAKAGKVHFNEVTVTKKMDSASPLFFRNCVTGMHLKNVILYLQPASGSVGDSMSINLGNAIVSSINWGDASGQQPTESLSFSFATVQVTYSKQSRAG